MTNLNSSKNIGQMSPSDWSGQFNADTFVIKQMIALINGATMVQIVNVTPSDDEVGIGGFVDVQPLVNLLDGGGNSTSHGVVYGLPFFRLQGGTNAIICDPKPRDIGFAVFCDRDISAVKNSRQQANPGSYRRFNMADGFYLGGGRNADAAQYLQFTESAINIVSPVAININAPNVTVNCQTATINASEQITLNAPQTTVTGALTVEGILTYIAGMIGSGGTGGSTAQINGSINATGEVTAAGIPLSTHIHPDVQPGSGNTGEPIA